MKKYIYLLLFIIFTCKLFAQENDSNLSESKKFHLFKNSNLSLDLKFIDPQKGSFGIDYNAKLSRKIWKIGKKNCTGSDFIDFEKTIDLDLSSNGFLTVVGNENTQNSIISELKINANPLFMANDKCLEQDRNWETDDFSPEEFAKLAAEVSSPLWVFFDLHVKHETTQDFKYYDFTIGSSLGFTTSYLTWLLDFPFGLIRSSNDNNPRQLDFSIGYDYVFDLKKTMNYSDSINQINMNRLNFKAEWETGILTKYDRLILAFDSYYQLSAPQEVKDSNKEFNYFFLAQLNHRLTENTFVTIKYTNGELPPNFNLGYVLGGGFSIIFP